MSFGNVERVRRSTKRAKTCYSSRLPIFSPPRTPATGTHRPPSWRSFSDRIACAHSLFRSLKRENLISCHPAPPPPGPHPQPLGGRVNPRSGFNDNAQRDDATARRTHACEYFPSVVVDTFAMRLKLQTDNTTVPVYIRREWEG